MSDDDRQAELQRRRAQARQAKTRRRRVGPVVVGLIALVVVVAGLAVGAFFGQGGSSSNEPPAKANAAGTSPAATAAEHVPAAAATTPAADPRKPASWPRSGAAAKSTRVPILMYHLVAAAPAGTAYPGLWVPPQELKAHVAALGDAGFVGVTLGEVWDAWHGDGKLPARPVVLSFDDGDISQVLGGAPVLKDAGWPGVLNLTVNHLGKGGIPMWGAKRLIKQGWDIDSHTVSHADLTTLSGDALTRELVDSRKQIKARLGVTPRFFCYPAGRNDAASRQAVEAAGYLAATTTEPGLAARSDDPFGLPRLRVDPGQSGAAIVALAKGQSTPSGGGE